MPSGFVGINTREPQTMLYVNGEIDCNEIKVNSIPINSFTNLCYGNNFAIGNWGRGNRVRLVTSPTLPTKSNSTQLYISGQQFVCSQLGTYEITSNIIFRNLSTFRQNPYIGIAINNDTNNTTTTTYTSPKWDLKLYSQTPFAVNYARLVEGTVCNLTAKRIYHFNNSTDYVSINTYIENVNGDEFGDSTPSYINLSACIEFKYIGNFDNIT